METSLRTQEQSETPEATDTARLRYVGEETHKLCYLSNMLFSAKCLLFTQSWCFHHCSTCLAMECFPNLLIAADYTECRHNKDRHIPKLYSTANISNPGTVPPQLQVSTSWALSFSLVCIVIELSFVTSCRDYHTWRKCLSLLSCQ